MTNHIPGALGMHVRDGVLVECDCNKLRDSYLGYLKKLGTFGKTMNGGAK